MRRTKAIAGGIAIIASLVGAQLASGSQPPLPVAAESEDLEAAFRIEMRVSELHTGMDAAEVARVLGRPTVTTDLDGSTGDDRALLYLEEPVITRVTLTGGRVTAIVLDLIDIDNGLLPTRARMVKPMMLRDGVLALLGKPDAEEWWTASGLRIEQMLFGQGHGSEFSVFLADGLVADVRAGAEMSSNLQPLILPAGIADASGTDLRILRQHAV
jgi:outer membrane protein assembly factor BamE (lipoprotein component of BamABCDE complex)